MILFKLVAEEVKAELGPICWHRTTGSTNRGGRKGLPNVNSSDDASAAASGLKIKLVQQLPQTRLATGGAAAGVQHERQGGDERGVLRQRADWPQSDPATRQVPRIPNYNLRYAKRSTQNSDVENIFSLRFQRDAAGGARLKNGDIRAMVKKQRGTAFTLSPEWETVRKTRNEMMPAHLPHRVNMEL